MIEEGITALEALGIAIRAEKGMQEVYRGLAAMCEDETHRDRFLNMQREEQRHQVLLEEHYKKMFPDVPLTVPEGNLPPGVSEGPSRKNPTLKDCLQRAVLEERRSREFYLDAAETTPDLSGKRMFRFLADMEFAHHAMLVAELEIMEKYPSYLEGGKPWEVESGLREEKMKGRTH